MTPERKLQTFCDELPKALLNFQHIEEALKGYLARSEVMIGAVVKDFMGFSIDERFQKNSLGTLIDKFKYRNKNSGLHQRLVGLVEERNFCAHVAYVRAYEKKDDGIALDTALTRLGSAIKESEDCFWMILEEIKKLEASFVYHEKKA